MTVKKVTSDFENMYFNTAISQMMIFINSVYKEDIFPTEYAEGFLKLLNPVTPHITEELWNRLGHNNTITYETWPSYDETKVVDDTINLPIQINGKVKTTILVPKDSSEEYIKELIHNNDTICRNLTGKTIRKEIYVKNKIYNIVAQ